MAVVGFAAWCAGGPIGSADAHRAPTADERPSLAGIAATSCLPERGVCRVARLRVSVVDPRFAAIETSQGARTTVIVARRTAPAGRSWSTVFQRNGLPRCAAFAALPLGVSTDLGLTGLRDDMSIGRCDNGRGMGAPPASPKDRGDAAPVTAVLMSFRW